MGRARFGTVRAIVLAGSHQWDATELDGVVPRPLLPILSAPLVSYGLQWLKSHGIERATMCANSASRLVRRCLGGGRGLGIELDYYEDMTPRGPAGCVRDAALATDADLFVVVDGSIIPIADLSDIIAHHQRSGAILTIVGTPKSSADRLSPVGIYVFSRSALEHIGATGYQDIKEILIPKLYERGQKVMVRPTEDDSPRVSGMDSYLTANARMLALLTKQGDAPEGYERRGEALIHETADVAATARIIGQAMIGPSCRVGRNAVIVGPTVVGRECQIDAEALVSRSVLWDRARVERGANVDRAIVGFEAVVPEGDDVHARYVTNVGLDRHPASASQIDEPRRDVPQGPVRRPAHRDSSPRPPVLALAPKRIVEEKEQCTINANP